MMAAEEHLALAEDLPARGLAAWRVCRTVSGSLQSASRSGMKRRPALDGSRNRAVLRASPTQSDPSAAGDRQSPAIPWSCPLKLHTAAIGVG